MAHHTQHHIVRQSEKCGYNIYDKYDNPAIVRVYTDGPEGLELARQIARLLDSFTNNSTEKNEENSK